MEATSSVSVPCRSVSSSVTHLESSLDGISPPLVPHATHHRIRHLVIDPRQLDVQRTNREIRWSNMRWIEEGGVERVRVGAAEEGRGVGEGCLVGRSTGGRSEQRGWSHRSACRMRGALELRRDPPTLLQVVRDVLEEERRELTCAISPRFDGST